MKLIENAEEWKDYDSHVSFELLMLKHRYQAAGEAMTPARRTQMQAHLRQKQAAIMEQHADAVAEELLASMTREEREALRARLARFDADAAAGRGGGGAGTGVPSGQVTAATLLSSPHDTGGDTNALRDALWELSSKVAAAARPAAAPPGTLDQPARPEATERGVAGARAAAATEDPMDVRQRHFDATTSLPFASPHATRRRRGGS